MNYNDDYQTWELPNVGNEEEDVRANALNIHRQQSRSAPVQANEIQPLTADDIEAIRQAAKEEGFAEGHAEGKAQGHAEGIEQGRIEGQAQGIEAGTAEGYKEGLAQAHAKAQLFASLAENMMNPLHKIDAEVEDQLLLLTIELVKSVLGSELTHNPNVIRNALKAAMEALPQRDASITIKCHPQDVAVIHDVLGDDEIEQRGIQISADESIQQGGCDVYTLHNSVDMTVQKRYRQVIERFMLEQGIANEPNVSE